MMRALPLMLLSMSLPLTAAAEERIPSIAAASVEETETAEIVRLVVSPAPPANDFDVVCGEGIIRVRLDGIANGGREIQSLPVPGRGPLRRVRIVEKNRHNTVVQMVPRRQPQTTCGRTSVAVLGGEIVISTARTPGEIARREARAAEAKEQEGGAAMRTPAAAEPVKSEFIEALLREKAAAADPISGETAAAQKDAAERPSSQKDAPASVSVIPGGQAALDAPRVALGFGFAAVVAGVALYLKRRKKGAVDDFESIEIISTKRLGIKQQLMLVSVQGVRYLLAVGDKTVAALGTVPEGGDGVEIAAGLPVVPPPLQAPPAAHQNVPEVLASLIGEASRRASGPVSQDGDTERFRFDEALHRAIAENRTRTAGERPDAAREQGPRQPELRGSGTRDTGSVGASSNAAGLVALARMRANIKKGSDKSQVFEA